MRWDCVQNYHPSYRRACLPVTSCSCSISHSSSSVISALPFRPTKISNPTRFANMSDQSSSDNTSSVTASSSSSPSPHTVIHSIRPAQARSESYTHVFPASRTVSTPKTSTTRKADLPCLATRTHVQDDRTRLLMGGLHWLLDASVKSQAPNKANQGSNRARFIREPPEPLSEKAITSLNARKDANIGGSLKPAETAAWIDGQRKSPAAPPF